MRVKPRRRASAAATVDLPAPAGPSIVITMSRRSPPRFTRPPRAAGRTGRRAPRSRPRAAPRGGRGGSSNPLADAADPVERSLDRGDVPGREESLQAVEGGAEGGEGLDEAGAGVLEHIAP